MLEATHVHLNTYSFQRGHFYKIRKTTLEASTHLMQKSLIQSEKPQSRGGKRTSFSSCTISAEGDNIVSMELHVFVWTWPIASHIAYLENSFTASGRLFDVSHVEKTWLFLTGVRLSTKSFIIGHWPGYETNYLFRHGVPNKIGF